MVVETGSALSVLRRDAEELHRALSDLVRVYQFRDRRRICCHDISVTQCYALEHVVREGPAWLRGLSEALYLDNSTASRVVDSLVRKGLITRGRDDRDRRAVSLQATEAGRQMHARIEMDMIEAEERLLEDIDPEVRQATTVLISRLARAARERFSAED